MRQKLLAVVGVSGCGKSSLVTAGMVPTLEMGLAGDPRQQWRIEILRPGDGPLRELERCLSFGGGPLAHRTYALREAVKTNLPADQNLLLVVDQFEEIFPFRDRKREGGGTEADLFISYLLNAAQEPAARIYIILTMRSDYLGECAKFDGLPEALNDGQYLVPRMTRSQLQEAIEKPLAAIVGTDGEAVEFHPGLVQRLLNDCDEEPDNLPLLQHLLRRLFEQWHQQGAQGQITPAMAQEVGELSDALNRDAEKVFQALSSEQQRIAEVVFRRITESRRQAGGTKDDRPVRRPQTLAHLTELAQTSEAALREVVDCFGGLLVVRSTVDLPHECLCLKWKRLEVWIEKESQDAKTLRFLADSVHQSHLAGSALTEAVAWQKAGRLKGAWGQRYLSRENLRQVDAWVTASQQLLDARAEEKAKSARRLRWLARGATALAVVAVGFGLWALSATGDANKAENKASLGEKAASVTNLLPTKPEKALLLAIQTTGENKEKLKEEDLPQVQSSLLSALQGAKWSNLFHTAEGLGATEDVLSFVLSSRDEKTIVSTHVLWKEMKMVVRLWDGKGNLIGSLPKQEAFAPVAISPDGMTVITRSDNGAVQLWSRKGELIKNLPLHGSSPGLVMAIATSADGKTIVTGKKGVVEFWNVEGESLGPSVSIKDKFDFEVVKISPDQQRILLLSFKEGNGAWLLDRTGKLLHLGSSVVSCEFSPDGQKIVTGSNDGTVQLWDRQGKLETSFKAHEGYVFAVAFSSDGGIFSGGTDGSVRLWNIAGKSLGEPRWLRGKVSSGAISRNEIVSGTLDGYVAFWPLDNGSPLEKQVSHAGGGTLSSITISPDGKTIVGGGNDGTVRIWNRAGKLIGETRTKKLAKVTSVAVSPDGQKIVTGSWDGTVQLWDREGKLSIEYPMKESAEVTSVAVSSNGTIVTGSKGGTVQLWDRERKLSIEYSMKEVTSVAISSNGTIVSGDIKGSVKVLRPGDAEPRILRDPPSFVKLATKSIAISPDGQTIVAGIDDGTVWLWILADEDKGKTPRPKTLRGHDQAVTSIAFSLYGKRIVTGSANGAVRLWDLKGNSMGSPLGRDTGNKDDVTVVAFSAKSDAHDEIVTVSRDDGRVWLWPIAKRENWLHEACNRVRNHLVFVDFDNNIAQEIAAELGAGIVEGAGKTCVELGNWEAVEKAIFLVRQGTALALRAKDSDVDKAVAKFQEAQNLDRDINLDRKMDINEKDPRAFANRLAAPAKARARVDDGRRLAQRGEIDKAIAAFQEAQKYDSKIDLDPRTRNITGNDPKAVAQQLAARAKVDDGRRLAQRGEIDKAIAAFQEAQKYDSKIDLDPGTRDTTGNDPKAVAQQLAARAKVDDGIRLVDDGRQLAQRGEIDKAIAAFQEAQKYDSKIDLDPGTRDTTGNDPKAVAQQLAARAKAQARVDEGRRLAQRGEIDKALRAYAEARKLDPSLETDAEFWNAVGWNFGLSGHAAEALKASEKAVELATKGNDPSLALIRDTRGLARALTGDKQGAIKDFEAFISSDRRPELKASRQQWVVALRNGQNPFTPEVLAVLRTQ